jgi:hypothetical protein
MINFKELTSSDYATYLPYFDNQRYTLCAYSLSSIIAWSNTEYKPFGAEYEDAFVVAAEFQMMKRTGICCCRSRRNGCLPPRNW